MLLSPDQFRIHRYKIITPNKKSFPLGFLLEYYALLLFLGRMLYAATSKLAKWGQEEVGGVALYTM